MPTCVNALANALFDDLPEAVVVADTRRRIVSLNDAFVEMFGYAREELIGEQTAVFYADPVDFEETGRAVYDARNQGCGRIYYVRYRRKNGNVFPARTSGVLIRDDDRSVIGFAGLIHDLSAAHAPDQQAEDLIESLSAERQLLRTLYHRTPVMMHTIGDDGRVRRVSDGWLERMGYTRDEVIGRKSTEFLTEASKLLAKSILPDFWTKGRCDRVPYTFLTKSGDPVEVELSARIEPASGETMTLAVLEDVTRRNQALRELRSRNQELREFAHAAAHDLRAPLRHIALFGEMMRENLAAGRLDEMGEHLDIVCQSVSHLSDMVKGLLDLSTTGEAGLNLATVDLAVPIARAMRQLRREIAAKGAEVVVGAMPEITCDPNLVERVFANILDNALKYVAEGVTPKIHISASNEDDTAKITVSDNGIGIDPAFLDRIFQPLKRLHASDSAYKGSGIGLALCRRIVEAHNGKIWAESSGNGSTFVVTFPALRHPRTSSEVPNEIR